MIRLLHWLATKLQRRDIVAEDQKVYLERYRVIGWMPGSDWSWPFSIYLHRFCLPDLDDALHNHPWQWAFSLVLTGSYMEEVPGSGALRRRCQMRRRFSWRIIRASDYHRVDKLFGETWTLFIVGPKVKSWGFLVDGRGHVPWKDRLAERGIPL